jgi:hypothetical protein
LTNIRLSYNINTEVETEVPQGISLSLQSANFVVVKRMSNLGKSS